MKRPLTLLAALLAALLTLTACSGSSDSHNQQDVGFASDMVIHHRSAITMAKLAPSRASSPEVKRLAADIAAAQGPEITTMTGWLRSWGADVPSDSAQGMTTADSMAGMMSASDMKQLEAARGAAFDELWLRGMLSHHRGAISMADTEIAKGESPAAIKLAKSIKASQSREVATMTSLLGS